MADGSFPTLVSKDRSTNANTNPIYISLVDAAGDAVLVDASGNLQVILAANDGVDIGDVTVNNGAGASAVNIQDGGNSISIDDGGGSITVDGSLSFDPNYDFVDDSAFTVASDYVAAVGMLADDTTPDSVDEGDIGIPRMTLDRKQLIVLADPTTDANRLAIDGSGNAQIDLAAISVTAVPVSKDGSANSETNPIYVYMVNTVVSGSEIHDYDTATPGADATSNHDYTVANATFFLKSVILSASGGMKAEVQVGPVASLASKAVAFIPRQGGTVQLDFNPAIEVPVASTGTVRIIRTNRQGASMDVYTTIIGNDV